MGKKGYTAVYVFGPTRCHSKYSGNEILDRENGEWVKIGQTDVDMPASALSDGTAEDIVAAAVKKRVTDEVRTGISDWCDIYDAFLFPKAALQVDGAIRNLLTNDIYELDNSKAERHAERGDIAPGKEYVYGCSRNHIKHAVESYDHQLVVSAADADVMHIKKICEFNNISMACDDEPSDDKGRKRAKRAHRNMDMVLSPGDVVSLAYGGRPVVDSSTGQAVTATYVGGNKYIYDGSEPMFSSPLAAELLNRFVRGKAKQIRVANGNDFWLAGGETLTGLFDAAFKSE